MSKLFYLSSVTLLTACLFSACEKSKEYPSHSRVKALGKELMSNLPGVFTIDLQDTEQLQGRAIPTIHNGNWVLSSQPTSLIDSFSKDTHTIAAFFVKTEQEFIRLSTTEENEVPGTPLSHESPAYKHLLGELRYTGKVVLSGKEYMADYDVFRDRQGRVVGAYLVAIFLIP